MGCKEGRKPRWGSPFFGLTSDYQIQLHTLLHDLNYIGHLSWEIAYEMPIQYRNFYVRRLMHNQEKERREHEAAARGNIPEKKSLPRGPMVKSS